MAVIDQKTNLPQILLLYIFSILISSVTLATHIFSMASGVIQPHRRHHEVILVNPGMTRGQLKVRVFKKWVVWDVLEQEKLVSVEMILLDQHGNKIQASIPEELFTMFDNKINEGKVYVISNLSVRSSTTSDKTDVLVFNENTEVKVSWGLAMPRTGVNVTGSNNVIEMNQIYQNLVDVIGVITYIRHDQNIFLDGTSTKTIIFKLTDNSECSNAYDCELSGQYVDVFRKMMNDNKLGLPLVVLQWVKVVKSQGKTIVRSVDGITKLYINPQFFEATKFKKGLVRALNQKRKTLWVPRTDKPTGFNFTTHIECKSIVQMMEDPSLGIFIINARLLDITPLDPWWYPVCGCGLIIESYLGDFCCGKCQAPDFEPSMKYRVQIVVEDNSGSTFLEAFDHVMLPIALIDPKKPEVTRNSFPRCFTHVLHKSIMLIVEKKNHNAKYQYGMFELLCVSDNSEVLKSHVHKEVCNTPSQAISKTVAEECILMKPIFHESTLTTTEKLLGDHLNPDVIGSRQWEAGESSNAGGRESCNLDATNSLDHDTNIRSVRRRLN